MADSSRHKQLTSYSDEEEWFINHWNDILTYPTIGDLCCALSEPADVISAKYRHLRQRCLLLDRQDRTPPVVVEKDLENEIWTSVLGWDGFYQVSNKGRVRSLDRTTKNKKVFKGKMLALSRNANGYLLVNLSANGVNKARAVHRLVMESFTGPHPGMVVRHKDHNRVNNDIDNLEWGTHSENMQDMANAFDEAALKILDHLADS